MEFSIGDIQFKVKKTIDASSRLAEVRFVNTSNYDIYVKTKYIILDKKGYAQDTKIRETPVISPNGKGKTSYMYNYKTVNIKDVELFKRSGDSFKSVGKKEVGVEYKYKCFVATSAFEDPDHVTVVTLRLYRDNFLSKYRFGQKFIKWYYNQGPHMAHFLDNNEFLKAPVRFILNTISKFIR
jgi:hypothetical protein